MKKTVRLIKSELAQIPWRFFGAGFASALLLVASFPYYWVWGLAFVGFVPFLVALLHARAWRQVFWLGFACMTFFILLGYTWISFVATNFGGLPWIAGKAVLLVFSLFAEIQFLLFALAAFAVFKQLATRARFKSSGALRAMFWLVALPVAYVGFDYLNPKMFPSAWGHVLYRWLTVAQLAEYFGVYGITLPVVLCNFAVAALVYALITRGRRQAAASAPGFAVVAPVAPAIAMLTALAVFFGWADSWGRKRIGELNALEKSFTRSFKVSVIQGNIADVDKLASERGYEPAIRHVLTTYGEMTRDSVRNFKPDLVIWPETAFPYLYTHLSDEAANRSGVANDRWIEKLVGEIKTPLFFGTYSSQGKRDFNTGFLVAPPYRLAGLYRKSILLAFGEYVPLGPLGPIIQDVVPTIANFGRGQGPMVIETTAPNPGVRLGPQICYEGIVPEHSRMSVALGADVLLNITNDSWFGDTTEPWLHLLLTVFRSIELRRPMIRSTNTGISTIVDITGEMRYSTRLFEPAQIDTTLRLPVKGQAFPTTFYQRHGEVFAQVCGFFGVWFAFFAVLPWIVGKASQRRARSKA